MPVRMRHPTLPGQEITVAESAAPHHQAAGWEIVEGEGETWPEELRPFEGQPVVRLRHPDLDAEIRVGESVVPFHRERGWLLVEEEPAAEVERVEVSSAVEGTATKSTPGKSTRRSQAADKEE